VFSSFFLYCFSEIKPILKIKKPLRAAERFGKIELEGQINKRRTPAEFPRRVEGVQGC
jgi:hypothetical protein